MENLRNWSLFVYLGAISTSDGKCKEDVRCWLGSARSV